MDHLTKELEQTKEEKKSLQKKLESKATEDDLQNFEDSALFRDFEAAISTANLELHKCKTEHKAEMKRIKEEHAQTASKL